MLQQLLTRVKLIVDCSYNGWNITAITNGITLGQVALSGTLTYTGALASASATSSPSITWPSMSSAQIQTSNPLLIVPKTSSTITVTVPASAVTRASGSAIPSASTSVPIQGFTLGADKSYTIRLKFKTLMFATSNIYWNGSRLTFDPYVQDLTTPSAVASMQKQGVMFKWGSLVGVSNPGTAGNQTTAWDAGSAVYVPTDNTGSAWTATTATAKGWTSWSNIPYVNDTYTATTSTVRTDSHLTTGVTADYATLKGDICQFIDNTYRMPTISEFSNNYQDYNTSQVGSTYLSTGADGQDLISSGATYAPANGMFFPASGYRESSGGLVDCVGYYGTYFSSSATTSTGTAYALSFHHGQNANTAGTMYRYQGSAVRCVLK
ncbi:hypothetical protein FACS1894182_02960 [Bacteroidia bacterium]|nr:hypothetical protein FACS1894182_02960 [Bacteroidia bacterium]